MKFVVLDVETTGLNPSGDRITEIGLVFIENFRIVGVFSRLFNPGITIPTRISQLTGITESMVRTESPFEDFAAELQELTRDHVVVGHHVNFDYSFIKFAMRSAGFSFTRKTVCTVEFSRYLFPDLRSHSLASLCRFLGVTNHRPHRALEDARATAEVFLKMCERKGPGFIQSLFSKRPASSLIPAHLREIIQVGLPMTTGVYYFIGKNNKPVYIGKAANIRSRVKSHFRGEGNSLKIMALANRIKEIRFTETGNELLASLLEDHEIRHYWPEWNAAQKKTNIRFGIIYYLDHHDQWRMAITRGGKLHCMRYHFHQYHLATTFLHTRVKQFGLDGNLCGIPHAEPVRASEHNRNFKRMMRMEAAENPVRVYLTQGRKTGESGFIWFENGQYKGFGFVDRADEKNEKVLRSNLIPRYSSITTENLLAEICLSKPQVEFNVSAIPQPALAW